MTHVLALDQGTTSSRAIIFDALGQPVAVAQQEFTQHFPKPGEVEHDPEEIWTSQLAVTEQVLQQAGIAAADIAAVGITNQRETVVVWERATGQPIYPAIVWQDRRTAAVCEQLERDGVGSLVRSKAGLVVDPYFSATKIAWLLDHVPGARARAENGELCFGTVDSWLGWKLTGGGLHITDASNASRTMLYDIRAGRWDEELCAAFRVPLAMLPEVRGSSEVYAEISVAPLSGRPLAGMAGDQQAALFGQMCTAPGLAKNTYGTGCFLLSNTGEQAVESQHRLLTTVAWSIGGKTEFALEGGVFIGGAVVQWLRDGLGILESSDDIEALAASVPDSGGAFFVPAFAGLGAPHWDSYARGTLCGLTRGTTRAHIARAALESIAFQVADLVDAMRRDDPDHATRELRVDGGAAVNDLLLQMQADLLQCPVLRPTCTETTALGAAYLAGLATGVWPSIDAIHDNWQIDRRFEPQRSADEVAEQRALWERAVKNATGWARPN